MTDPRDTPEDMARRTAPPDPGENRRRTEQLIIRVDDGELEEFRRAAERAGVPLSTWARVQLRRAAGMLTP